MEEYPLKIKSIDAATGLGFFIALMRLQTSRKNDWEKLAQIMISTRDLNHAEELCQVLPESIDACDMKEIVLLYDNLGIIILKNGR